MQTINRCSAPGPCSINPGLGSGCTNLNPRYKNSRRPDQRGSEPQAKAHPTRDETLSRESDDMLSQLGGTWAAPVSKARGNRGAKRLLLFFLNAFAGRFALLVTPYPTRLARTLSAIIMFLCCLDPVSIITFQSKSAKRRGRRGASLPASRGVGQVVLQAEKVAVGGCWRPRPR